MSTLREVTPAPICETCSSAFLLNYRSMVDESQTGMMCLACGISEEMGKAIRFPIAVDYCVLGNLCQLILHSYSSRNIKRHSDSISVVPTLIRDITDDMLGMVLGALESGTAARYVRALASGVTFEENGVRRILGQLCSPEDLARAMDRTRLREWIRIALLSEPSSKGTGPSSKETLTVAVFAPRLTVRNISMDKDLDGEQVRKIRSHVARVRAKMGSYQADSNAFTWAMFNDNIDIVSHPETFMSPITDYVGEEEPLVNVEDIDMGYSRLLLSMRCSDPKIDGLYQINSTVLYAIHEVTRYKYQTFISNHCLYMTGGKVVLRLGDDTWSEMTRRALISCTGVMSYTGSPFFYAEHMTMFYMMLREAFHSPKVIASMKSCRKVKKDVWVEGATTSKNSAKARNLG